MVVGYCFYLQLCKCFIANASAMYIVHCIDYLGDNLNHVLDDKYSFG